MTTRRLRPPPHPRRFRNEKIQSEQANGNAATKTPAASETEATVNAAKEEATAAPVPQADGDPRPEQATDGTRAGSAEQGSAVTAVDPEAAAAAEEAAGSEEMSKLIEQYSEPQEGAAQNEIIEVKVVAYTEHGVVVDVGGKTEGLIPAVEFSETDIPRPEPNATIEVQRTGEHKDGYVILSYQKVLRRRTWEKIDAAYKAKETVTGKVVDRIKGGLVVDVGVRAFLAGIAVRSAADAKPGQSAGPGSAGAHHQAEPAPRQRGGEPAGAAGRRAALQARAVDGDAERRADGARAREERDGVRRVRRSRRN